jgi:hypothetical protein
MHCRSVLLLTGIEGIGIDFGQSILDTDTDVQDSVVSRIDSSLHESYDTDIIW